MKSNDYYLDEDGFRRDIVEKDPFFQSVLREAEKEAQQKLEQRGIKTGAVGYYKFFWQEKKIILREKYGIDWKTPQEMNPEINFD